MTSCLYEDEVLVNAYANFNYTSGIIDKMQLNNAVAVYDNPP